MARGNGQEVLDAPPDDDLVRLRADLGSLEHDLEHGDGDPIDVLVNITEARRPTGDEPIILQFSDTTFGDRKMSPSQAWKLGVDLQTASTFAGQLRQDVGKSV
jgi:hypothetical protein